jgi:hypothetical protein
MPNALAPEVQNMLMYSSQQGINPFGFRHDSPTLKGKGFFGALRNRYGQPSTEISTVTKDGFDYPLMVPTLTRQELYTLLNAKEGEQLPDTIYEKAYKHAMQRQAQGLSPFAGSSELRIPVGMLPVYGY